MRRLLPLLPLLLTLPVTGRAQTAGSLPPPVPRTAAPAPSAAPVSPQAPVARRPEAPRAATPAPAPASRAAPSLPATPGAAAPRPAPARPGPAQPAPTQASPAQTGQIQNGQPRNTPARSGPARPGQPRVVTPQGQPNRRRPAAAAAAAGAAAGAAAAPPAPAPAPVPEPQPTTGSVTNLPLPRFASLRAEEVNMRAGPGTRYPIEWTYQRRELPVEIVREFELWRRVRDMEGTEGWVLQSNLTGRRTFVVTGEERVLRRRPEESAGVVARLRPGVLGRIRLCTVGEAWCEVTIGEHKGWLRRADFFGVMPDEEVK